jgi:lysozyme family protein
MKSRKQSALEYWKENEEGKDRKVGEISKFGVTPDLAKSYGVGNLISLTQEKAQEIVWNEYWQFDQIRNGRIAIKLFDTAADQNCGVRRAVKIAQLVLKQMGYLVDVSGLMDSLTVRRLNEVPIEDFLVNYSREQEKYYRSIAFRDQGKLKYLSEWIRRALRSPFFIQETSTGNMWKGILD